MKYYAVIDTNVLVSAALKWNSVPGNIIELALNGFIVPLLNDSIIEEYREVMIRPKFHLTEEIVEAIVGGIIENGLFVSAETQTIELPDSKDKVFYEVVMEGRKKEDVRLITGNIKHFPEAPFVVTPHHMLDIISSETISE